MTKHWEDDPQKLMEWWENYFKTGKTELTETPKPEWVYREDF